MAKAKYTKGSDGYYQTKVWDGTYTELGKKKYVTLRTDKSSKALEKLVNEHNRAVEERRLVKKTDMLFTTYAKTWRTVYKANREKNTLAMYDRIIGKFSVLEGVRLCDISRLHYQTVINNADGHPRTQQQIVLTFKQILKSAVADRYLPANIIPDIFDHADRIKYYASEKRPLTETEKAAVFRADLLPQEKAFLYVLYGCGLRRGEALALTRFDIDLQRCTLSVRRALAFDGNSAYIKGTKSSNGIRTVPIPSKVLPFLRTYCHDIHREKLFCTRDGSWVTKSSYRKMWSRILAGLQAVADGPIEGLTAHVFRHNYCTNLCYQIPAISIGKVAELLGDTEKMVLEVYNHIIAEKEDTAGAVESALNF